MNDLTKDEKELTLLYVEEAKDTLNTIFSRLSDLIEKDIGIVFSIGVFSSNRKGWTVDAGSNLNKYGTITLLRNAIEYFIDKPEKDESEDE